MRQNLHLVTTLPAGVTLESANSVANDGTIFALGYQASTNRVVGLLLTPSAP